ncbi:MAG: nicotinamide riboside transporter PnuC [Bacteroidales bacterium]|jgi:nicotinamide mononucleotide transporter|nr:nicotinamide mononucleotide transporter [Bacteroidales bacterium]MDI9592298.1 nicotinamide riboside transporter PnuC [Bacteroidota bacterium]OQC37163.1 MAG: Nicotinamide riboside transporter PnuC [Bacteroidetes bacterium ADurb.Bin041]MBP7874236.1 nicotinamide mononucleotide transporter [Bacteroidales bacterium]MCO6467284.1 nicotinamide mononucleotide transporter [Bacteroidales bacterium]
MLTTTFFDLFYQNLLQSTWLEGVAVIFGLLSVWYAKKANILVYPTGIISVLIYVYICYHAGIYADMGINFFYFLVSVFGWYKWTRKDSSNKELAISRCSLLHHFIWVLLTIISFLILQYILRHYTDSTIPYIDSFTTAIFITGMGLMALKKVENWIYWIIGDLVSVPLYFHKELVLTSFQYFVFLILAVLGYIEWKRILKQSEVEQTHQNSHNRA